MTVKGLYKCKRATWKQQGPMQVGPMNVKGPTELNIKHGGRQKIFRSQTYPLLPHFQMIVN